MMSGMCKTNSYDRFNKHRSQSVLAPLLFFTFETSQPGPENRLDESEALAWREATETPGEKGLRPTLLRFGC